MTNSFKSPVIAIVLLLTIISINSCRKQPGDGGLATIQGKVYGYNMNNFGLLIDSGYVADTRVFLSYGNHTWADDDTRTSYTGEYSFPFLNPGNYTVWVINQCDTCALNQSFDIRQISIDKPRETVRVSDLINYF